MICERCGKCTYVIYIVAWTLLKLCGECHDKWKPPETEWELIQRRNELWLNQQTENSGNIESKK